MDYFPETVTLVEKKCIVVGGNATALKKIKELMSAGARVSVLNSTFIPEIFELTVNNSFELIQSEFMGNYIDDAFLVISTTHSKQLNAKISEACRDKSIWLNVVDDFSLSTFLLPEIEGHSVILVATRSGSIWPTISKKIAAFIKKVVADSINRILNKSQTKLKLRILK